MTDHGEQSRGAGRREDYFAAHPALTDELTGLPNRLHFDVIFKVIFEMGDRGVPLTVLMMALDYFERFEQDNGENAAVEAMKDFGITLARHIRKTDLLARTAHDRYVVLLMDANLQGGLLAADRLLELLAGFMERTALTFSVGVASYQKGMTEPRVLEDEAAMALKLAQDSGGATVKIPADAGE